MSCVFITLLCNNYFPQKFITHKDLESLLHSFPSSPAVVCGFQTYPFDDLCLRGAVRQVSRASVSVHTSTTKTCSSCARRWRRLWLGWLGRLMKCFMVDIHVGCRRQRAGITGASYLVNKKTMKPTIVWVVAFTSLAKQNRNKIFILLLLLLLPFYSHYTVQPALAGTLS